jgi:hypothetical protein
MKKYTLIIALVGLFYMPHTKTSSSPSPTTLSTKAFDDYKTQFIISGMQNPSNTNMQLFDDQFNINKDWLNGAIDALRGNPNAINVIGEELAEQLSAQLDLRKRNSEYATLYTRIMEEAKRAVWDSYKRKTPTQQPTTIKPAPKTTQEILKKEVPTPTTPLTDRENIELIQKDLRKKSSIENSYTNNILTALLNIHTIPENTALYEKDRENKTVFSKNGRRMIKEVINIGDSVLSLNDLQHPIQHDIKTYIAKLANHQFLQQTNLNKPSLVLIPSENKDDFFNRFNITEFINWKRFNDSCTTMNKTVPEFPVPIEFASRVQLSMQSATPREAQQQILPLIPEAPTTILKKKVS